VTITSAETNEHDWPAPCGGANDELVFSHPVIGDLSWEECLWRRWPVCQRAVWPDGAILPPPAFRDAIFLQDSIEDLTVQELVSQLPVEWLDEDRLDTKLAKPTLDHLCRELRAVVRAKILWRSPKDEQL